MIPFLISNNKASPWLAVKFSVARDLFFPNNILYFLTKVYESFETVSAPSQFAKAT